MSALERADSVGDPRCHVCGKEILDETPIVVSLEDGRTVSFCVDCATLWYRRHRIVDCAVCGIVLERELAEWMIADDWVCEDSDCAEQYLEELAAGHDLRIRSRQITAEESRAINADRRLS